MNEITTNTYALIDAINEDGLYYSNEQCEVIGIKGIEYCNFIIVEFDEFKQN